MQQLQTVTAQQAASIVQAQRNSNKIFSVVFTKKDGSLRTMQCLFNVKKHLTTNKASTTAHIAKYVTVFCCTKKQYRNVNVQALHSVTVANTKYIVQH